MERVILDQQLEQKVSTLEFPEPLANMLLLNSGAINEIDLFREKIKSEDYVGAEVAIKNVVNALNKLTELGRAELPKMKWKEEDFYEALLAIVKAKKSLEGRVTLAVAEIILFKGKKLIEDGHWQYGLETLQVALEQFRKLNDLDGSARAFIEIGAVQELFGDYEVARLSFLDAERLFKKTKREEGIAVAELQLGTLALDHYDYEQARPHLKFASNFFHQYGDQERAKLSDDFLKLADEFEHDLALV